MLYLIPLIFCILIGCVAIIVSYNSLVGVEQSTPFECGLNPLGPQRLPFSLQFALLGLLFLLFDVEVVIILPVPINNFVDEWAALIISLVVLILLISLIYEWYFGKLEWE